MPQAWSAPHATVDNGVINGAESCAVKLSPKQIGVREEICSKQTNPEPATKLRPKNGPAIVTKVELVNSTAAHEAEVRDACETADAATLAMLAAAPKQNMDEFVASTEHVKLSAAARPSNENGAPGTASRPAFKLKHESEPSIPMPHVCESPGLIATKVFGEGSTHIPV